MRKTKRPIATKNSLITFLSPKIGPECHSISKNTSAETTFRSAIPKTHSIFQAKRWAKYIKNCSLIRGITVVSSTIKRTARPSPKLSSTTHLSTSIQGWSRETCSLAAIPHLNNWNFTKDTGGLSLGNWTTASSRKMSFFGEE